MRPWIFLHVQDTILNVKQGTSNRGPLYVGQERRVGMWVFRIKWIGTEKY